MNKACRNLMENKEQLDANGVMVAVSHEALMQVIGCLSIAEKELDYIKVMTHKNAQHMNYFEIETIKRKIAAIHLLCSETLETVHAY